MDNGHRWLILTNTGSVGIGEVGSYNTGNFSTGTAPAKIPSGSHYPQPGRYGRILGQLV